MVFRGGKKFYFDWAIFFSLGIDADDRLVPLGYLRPIDVRHLRACVNDDS